MSNKFFYTDINNNYYIDTNNNYYITFSTAQSKNLMAFIWHNGSFKRVKPRIIKIVNMEKIPEMAMMTNTGIPFLTNSKEYFTTTNTSDITDVGSEDYILYDKIKCTPYILHTV